MAFSAKSKHDALLSAHARYAARAAEACGYAFRSLDGADGYLFEVRDGARAAVFAAGAGTPYALNDARAASVARDKAFCAETLRQAGVPVLPGRMFFVTQRWADMRSPGREPEDARLFAATAEYPLFCKPLSASNGLYAEVIEHADAFGDYMERVAREHFAILAQPYVRAVEHRVFVLNGRVLFSYRKLLPQVTGDGLSTLGALVKAAPRDPHAPPLKPRGRDPRGHLIGAHDVPRVNEAVILEGPANRAAGGGTDGLCDDAPAAMARVALASVEALGLRLAAVDLFDLSGDGADLAVIEVNSNPMIATLEEHERWDLIIEIWRANIETALR
ncbi:MAG: ATP-grasp domain-containing protein [Caulobacteraceae bacterium]